MFIMHGLVQLVHRPSIFSLEIVKHAYRNRNRGGFSFALRPRSRGPLSLSLARARRQENYVCVQAWIISMVQATLFPESSKQKFLRLNHALLSHEHSSVWRISFSMA